MYLNGKKKKKHKTLLVGFAEEAEQAKIESKEVDTNFAVSKEEVKWNIEVGISIQGRGRK